MSQITAQKVLEELASNETLQYIQKLETENEKLKKEVLSFSNQLQAAKVIVCSHFLKEIFVFRTSSLLFFQKVVQKSLTRKVG
jgi:hypothetical protein